MGPNVPDQVQTNGANMARKGAAGAGGDIAPPGAATFGALKINPNGLGTTSPAIGGQFQVQGGYLRRPDGPEGTEHHFFAPPVEYTVIELLIGGLHQRINDSGPPAALQISLRNVRTHLVTLFFAGVPGMEKENFVVGKEPLNASGHLLHHVPFVLDSLKINAKFHQVAILVLIHERKPCIRVVIYEIGRDPVCFKQHVTSVTQGACI